ncbi:MAG: hypothetical protein A2X12_02355 [Bacteroidetes bacterium GWE2_29_8]|nr:MAG: hypothetical protein A2X12_02355 [Bacteroidetes bacterium GWE2_29_8]OFY14608.1 MAG: hypothetical protein A2X02_05940 [Bacteroidetes bacterium GWF2_29_10]
MNEWLIIILAVIGSAFFSGIEIAFFSTNKLQILIDKKKGKTSARILQYYNDNVSKFIGTILLGNNLAIVIYGTLVADKIDYFLKGFIPSFLLSDFNLLLAQTIISTIFILVFAEFLPKVLFRLYSYHIITFFSIPTFIIYCIFFPITIVIVGLSELLIVMTKGSKKEKRNIVFGRLDLDNYITQVSIVNNEGEMSTKEEITMFQNAIEFHDIKVRECMVPRTEIVAVDENSDIQVIKNSLIKTGFSRIVIYSQNIDNIIGFVHVYDMFGNNKCLKEMIRPLLIIPETMPAKKLLSELIGKNKSIAVVVDEFGGTAGLVTLEDIVEKIVGEIDDEYDNDKFIEKKINDMEYVLSSRIEIDYLNEKYSFNIPETDEYTTIGGFILNRIGRIPFQNEEIIIEKFIFTILKVNKNKIDLIKLKFDK